MLVVPDPSTAFLDPFTAAATLVLICNIRDPVTGETYSRDARHIAQKAEAYLKSTGIADTAYFGPEAGWLETPVLARAELDGGQVVSLDLNT